MTAQLDVFAAAAVEEIRVRVARRSTARPLRHVLDVILDRVPLGEEFSANDIRGHLDPAIVNLGGLGGVLFWLERYDVVLEVGREPSTDPATRGAHVKRYLLLHPAEGREDPAAITVRRRRYGTGWRWRAEWPEGSVEASSRGVLETLLRPLVLRSGLPVREPVLPAAAPAPAPPAVTRAVLHGLRDLNGALTGAGLRARLIGVPDDAVVLVHTDGADGEVLGIADAYDDGPASCADEDGARHIFRIQATDDPDDLLAAAEEPTHA